MPPAATPFEREDGTWDAICNLCHKGYCVLDADLPRLSST